MWTILITKISQKLRWEKNWTFLVQGPEKGDPVTPCMGVYKAKIQSDGSLGKLKLRIWSEEIFRIKI